MGWRQPEGALDKPAAHPPSPGRRQHFRCAAEGNRCPRRAAPGPAALLAGGTVWLGGWGTAVSDKERDSMVKQQKDERPEPGAPGVRPRLGEV